MLEIFSVPACFLRIVNRKYPPNAIVGSDMKANANIHLVGSLNRFPFLVADDDA
jgi:hypothetical protein